MAKKVRQAGSPGANPGKSGQSPGQSHPAAGGTQSFEANLPMTTDGQNRPAVDGALSVKPCRPVATGGQSRQAVRQAESKIRAVNETGRQGGKPGRKVKKQMALPDQAVNEVITPNGKQKSSVKRKATAGRRGRKQTVSSGAECPEKPATAGRRGRKQTPDESPGAAKRTQKTVLALVLILLFDLVLGAFCFTVLFLRPSAGFWHRAQVVVIPDASGADEAAARALFSPTDGDGALYSLSVQYEYAAAPRGTVLSQVPAAGVRRKAVPGMRPCPVTLCVSLGKKTVVVPELAGKDAREAEALLLSLGFPAECRMTGHSRVSFTGLTPGGTVRETIPPAGTALAEGETVVVILNPPAAPEASGVIPDLRGLGEKEAGYRLLAAGFLVGQVTEVRKTGGFPGYGEAVVTGQQYVAGTLMMRGTRVGFTVTFSSPFAER